MRMVFVLLLAAAAMAEEKVDLGAVYRIKTEAFQHSKVMEHAFYAGLSLLLAGLFLWRRQPADIPMAGLQLASAAFAASFFIISIACDYRYMYFTDLASMAGLLYAAYGAAAWLTASPGSTPRSTR